MLKGGENMAVKQTTAEKTNKTKEQVKKAQRKKKKKPGPKAMYLTPALMQKKIDEYFESCKGELWLDENGQPKTTKHGFIYKIAPKPLTKAGLQLFLGFATRQSLLDYKQKNERFTDTIERAYARIEDYACQQLFYKDSATGAKFYLQSAFGYDGKDNTIFISNQANASAATNFNNFSDDELKAILNQAKKSSESGESD